MRCLKYQGYESITFLGLPEYLQPKLPSYILNHDLNFKGIKWIQNTVPNPVNLKNEESLAYDSYFFSNQNIIPNSYLFTK